MPLTLHGVRVPTVLIFALNFKTMDVKFVLVILILTTLEFSNAKSEKDKKKEKDKKGKNPMTTAASIATGMTNVEEQIAELKKQVASLPKNVVHIHMHDGHAEHHRHKHDHHKNTSDSEEKSDDHHRHRHDKDDDDDHHHGHSKDHDDDDHHHGENDQHIHMHMHVEGDCHDHDKHDKDEEIHAHCEVEANSNLQDGEDITGQIHMVQKGKGPVDIYIKLSGFDTTKQNAQLSHGFHVHTYGDMRDSCDSLGPHFDPEGTKHAGKDDKERHVGDLGNIDNDINGEVDHNMTDDKISLRGKNSLIGRSIVIHAGPDDLGTGGSPASETSGNSGARIACCIIARGNPALHHQSPKTTTVKPVVTDGGK